MDQTDRDRNAQTGEQTEVAALRLALQQADALVGAKERELAAQRQLIALLREKIQELERMPMEGFRFASSADKPKSASETRPASAPKAARKPAVEEPPKSAWARFYKWFREA